METRPAVGHKLPLWPEVRFRPDRSISKRPLKTLSLGQRLRGNGDAAQSLLKLRAEALGVTPETASTGDGWGRI